MCSLSTLKYLIFAARDHIVPVFVHTLNHVADYQAAEYFAFLSEIRLPRIAANSRTFPVCSIFASSLVDLYFAAMS